MTLNRQQLQQQRKLDLLAEIANFLKNDLALESLSPDADRKRLKFVSKLTKLSIYQQQQPQQQHPHQSPTGTVNAPPLPERNQQRQPERRGENESKFNSTPRSPTCVPRSLTCVNGTLKPLQDTHQCITVLDKQTLSPTQSEVDAVGDDVVGGGCWSRSTSSNSQSDGDPLYRDSGAYEEPTFLDHIPAVNKTVMTVKPPQMTSSVSSLPTLGPTTGITSQSCSTHSPAEGAKYMGTLYQKASGRAAKTIFCVVHPNGTLSCFRSLKDINQPTKSYQLANCSVSFDGPTELARKVMFGVRLTNLKQGSGDFDEIFYAETQTEAERWVKELQDAAMSSPPDDVGSATTSAGPEPTAANDSGVEYEVLQGVIQNVTEYDQPRKTMPQSPTVRNNSQPVAGPSSAAADAAEDECVSAEAVANNSTLKRNKKKKTTANNNDTTTSSGSKSAAGSTMKSMMNRITTVWNPRTTLSRIAGKMLAKEVKILDDPTTDLTGNVNVCLDFSPPAPSLCWSSCYCVVKDGILNIYNSHEDTQALCSMTLKESDIMSQTKVPKRDLTVRLIDRSRHDICLEFHDRDLHAEWITTLIRYCKSPKCSRAEEQNTDDDDNNNNSNSYDSIDVNVLGDKYVSMDKRSKNDSEADGTDQEHYENVSSTAGGTRYPGQRTPWTAAAAVEQDTSDYEEIGGIPPPVPASLPPAVTPASSSDDDDFDDENHCSQHQISSVVSERHVDKEELGGGHLLTTVKLSQRNELRIVEGKKCVQERLKIFQP